MMGIPRRNYKTRICGVPGHDRFVHWLLGKHETDTRSILCRLSIGSVVHLKNDVRTLFDFLGSSDREYISGIARSNPAQEVFSSPLNISAASGCLGVSAALCRV